MRYLIAAILAAGIAGALSPGEYAIEIFGTADGFIAHYVWLVEGEGGDITYWVEGEPENEWAISGPLTPYHYETVDFAVDSLTEIRPTPAEMEKGE